MFAEAQDAVAAASAHTSDRWLWAWALGYAAVGAASLLIPLYALALGASPLVVGLVEATAGLAGVPGALVWGRLADRTGNRRAFVVVSLVGTAAVLFVVPTLDTVGAVLAANAVLWFVLAAAAPVVTLFMIEGAPRPRWEGRIGLLNAAQRYGWVGGLVAGTAWLGAASLRWGSLAAQRGFFVVCGAASLAAAPLAVYWLPPTATTSSARLARSRAAMTRLAAGGVRYVKLVPYLPLRAAGAASRNPLGRLPPALQRYMVAAFAFSVGFAAFFGPVPAFLESLRYDSATIFAFFIVSNLASAVAFVPVGRRAAAGDPTLLQLGALGVRVVLFPAIGALGLLPVLALRVAGLGVAFALVGLTWAVVAVTAAGLVSRRAPDAVRGEALGLFTALSGLGTGVGGALGGWLALSAGYLPAFAVAGLAVLVGAALVAASGVRTAPDG